MLGNCNPKEWIVYKHLGARKLGEPFAAFGREDCQLVYTDIDKAIAGKLLMPSLASIAIYAHIGDPVRKKLGIVFLGIRNGIIDTTMAALRSTFSNMWMRKKIKEFKKTGRIK